MGNIWHCRRTGMSDSCRHWWMSPQPRRRPPCFVLNSISLNMEATMIDRVLKHIDSHQSQSVDGLKDFLRIPSVSTKPEHAQDLQRCAQWLAGRLREAKLDVKVEPTKGHPIVLAKNEHKTGRKTVLLYGHYDVQPPEPLEQWVSPPFEPTLRKT